MLLSRFCLNQKKEGHEFRSLEVRRKLIALKKIQNLLFLIALISNDDKKLWSQEKQDFAFFSSYLGVTFCGMINGL